jgi:hypothetical protein
LYGIKLTNYLFSLQYFVSSNIPALLFFLFWIPTVLAFP